MFGPNCQPILEIPLFQMEGMGELYWIKSIYLDSLVLNILNFKIWSKGALVCQDCQKELSWMISWERTKQVWSLDLFWKYHNWMDWKTLVSFILGFFIKAYNNAPIKFWIWFSWMCTKGDSANDEISVKNDNETSVRIWSTLQVISTNSGRRTLFVPCRIWPTHNQPRRWWHMHWEGLRWRLRYFPSTIIML